MPRTWAQVAAGREQRASRESAIRCEQEEEGAGTLEVKTDYAKRALADVGDAADTASPESVPSRLGKPPGPRDLPAAADAACARGGSGAIVDTAAPIAPCPPATVEGMDRSPLCQATPCTGSVGSNSAVECSSSEEGGIEDLVLDPGSYVVGPPPGLGAPMDLMSLVSELEPWVGNPNQVEMQIGSIVEEIARRAFCAEFRSSTLKVRSAPPEYTRNVCMELQLAEAAVKDLLAPLARLQGAVLQQMPSRGCQVYSVERARDNSLIKLCCAQVNDRSCWDAVKHGVCPRGGGSSTGGCCRWDHPAPTMLHITVIGDGAASTGGRAPVQSSAVTVTRKGGEAQKQPAWWSGKSVPAPNWDEEWGKAKKAAVIASPLDNSQLFRDDSSSDDASSEDEREKPPASAEDLCAVCDGTGFLLRDMCPLCEGVGCTA